MADNYLENKYEEYKTRKAAVEKARKQALIKQQKALLAKIAEKAKEKSQNPSSCKS